MFHKSLFSKWFWQGIFLIIKEARDKRQWCLGLNPHMGMESLRICHPPSMQGEQGVLGSRLGQIIMTSFFNSFFCSFLPKTLVKGDYSNCSKPFPIVSLYRYSRKSLRVLGTVGEPINPEAWMFYFHKIGDSRCPIVDTFWQTETVSCYVVYEKYAMCKFV